MWNGKTLSVVLRAAAVRTKPHGNKRCRTHWVQRIMANLIASARMPTAQPDHADYWGAQARQGLARPSR